MNKQLKNSRIILEGDVIRAQSFQQFANKEVQESEIFVRFCKKNARNRQCHITQEPVKVFL